MIRLCIEEGVGEAKRKLSFEVALKEVPAMLEMTKQVLDTFYEQPAVLRANPDVALDPAVIQAFNEFNNKMEPVETEQEKYERKLTEVKRVKEDPNALALPIGEHLGILKKEIPPVKVESTSEPEHWSTGIKLAEDGQTKLYQVRYVCPKCGKKSKRFRPAGDTFCTCHDCGTRISIRPAVDGEPFGVKDSWNNYYFGDTLYEEPIDEGEEYRIYDDWLPTLELENGCVVMDDDGARALRAEGRYDVHITKKEATKYFLMCTMKEAISNYTSLNNTVGEDITNYPKGTSL